MTTALTISMLVIYIAVMMGIGLYTTKKTKSVNDFVLGGRNVGSWLTAFAYGTSYFSAVVFIFRTGLNHQNSVFSTGNSQVQQADLTQLRVRQGDVTNRWRGNRWKGNRHGIYTF